MKQSTHYPILDRTISLLLVVFSVILLLFISDIKLILIAISTIVAAISYLVLSYKSQDNELPIINTSHISILSNAIFVFIYAYTLYLLHTSLYHRPILYFILISFLCGIIAIDIALMNKETTFSKSIILFKILLIATSIRFGVIYLHPGMAGGGDPWYHVNFAKSIVEIGYVPPQLQYTYYPIMQIQVAIVNLLTSFQFKDALTASTGLSTIFSIIFVYLLGQHIFNSKVGLFSALIISFSSLHLYRGIVLQAMTMGLVLFTIILFLMYFEENRHTLEIKVLFIIFSFTIIITHFIAPIILFIPLVISYFSTFFKRNKLIASSELNIGIKSISIFILILVSYWMYTSLGDNQSVFQYAINNLQISLETGGVAPSTYVKTVESIPIVDEILSNISFVSIFGLSVLGTIYVFGTKKIKSNRLALIFCAYGLFAIIGILGIRGDTNMLPERWLPFVAILIAILASFGLYSIQNSMVIKKYLVILFGIFFVIALLNVTNAQSNSDVPLYVKNIIIRTSFFESELSASDFAVNKYNFDICTDPILAYQIKYQSAKQIEIYQQCSTPNYNSTGNYIYVIRNYIYSNYVFTAYNPYKVDITFLDQLTSNKSNIYNNGEVKMFTRYSIE